MMSRFPDSAEYVLVAVKVGSGEPASEGSRGGLYGEVMDLVGLFLQVGQSVPERGHAWCTANLNLAISCRSDRYLHIWNMLEHVDHV